MSDCESSDGECEDTSPFRGQGAEVEWFTTHYEVLAELYKIFRDSGELTFGLWFFQHGGFHDFVHFVYAYSALSSKH
jgi:hypothetical protein